MLSSAILVDVAATSWFAAAPPLPPPPPAVPSTVWTPTVWTVFLTLSLLGTTILYQMAVRAGKPKRDGSAPVKVKDHVEPSLALSAHTYSGYAYLYMRGKFLDGLQFMVHALTFWKRLGGAGESRGPRAGPPISAKYGPPFNSGWVIFYTRRMYSRIQDCWNRPIAGEAATSIDVCLRERAFRGDAAPLVRTGKTKHCLNLGSYNYLGFGGVDPICTPAVIGALKEYGVSSCSSRMEAGSRSVHAQLEETVATFLDKPSAIVIGMGFATNSFVIPVLVDPQGNGKGVLLLSDALNHSSIVEGVRGSGAKVLPFAHNSMDHLESILANATERGQPSGVGAITSLGLPCPSLAFLGPKSPPCQFPWPMHPHADPSSSLPPPPISRHGVRSSSSSRASTRWRASSPTSVQSWPSRKSTMPTCILMKPTLSGRWARAAVASPTTWASTPRTSTS